MHYKLYAVACRIAGMTGHAYSQPGLGGYPFDSPADPRSFAMGESFTALPSNPSALMYNPAGLAGLTGLRVSYSQRSLATNSDWTLRSFNAAIGTPIGSFAAQYNRDSYGMLPFSSLGVDLLVQYAVIPWISLSAFSIDIQY